MPLRGVFVEFQSLSKSRRVQTSVLPKNAYFLRTLLPIFFSKDGNWKKNATLRHKRHPWKSFELSLGPPSVIPFPETLPPILKLVVKIDSF